MNSRRPPFTQREAVHGMLHRGCILYLLVNRMAALWEAKCREILHSQVAKAVSLPPVYTMY